MYQWDPQKTESRENKDWIKKKKKTGQNIQGLWNNYKRSKIHIMRISDREERNRKNIWNHND